MVAPERCPSARRGLRYYQRQERIWRDKTGAGPVEGSRPDAGSCSRVRYLAKRERLRAHRARLAYERWAYSWAWWIWMPDKWQRIGACETGYGKRPGDFRWNSGTYQGFVGFAVSTWDAYRPAGFPSEAYNATPRQQLIVAEIVRDAVGYGGWGCGGA